MRVPVCGLRWIHIRPPVWLEHWPYTFDPRAEAFTAWRAYGWRAEPDPVGAQAEHEAFRAALTDAGAEVIEGATDIPGDPDAIYAYDPVLMTDAGTIVLRPGKPGRRGEPEAVAADLERSGIQVAGRLTEPATAEGGDMFWLDPSTLLVGIGYRTNELGVEQLRKVLAPHGANVVAFDLPHLEGPDECLHLLSFISPLASDLAIAYLRLMPVRLVQLLRSRAI